MPSTPALPDLASPDRGARYLSERLPSSMILKGQSATRTAVAQAMPQPAWAHFSCHGSQDLHQPYRAALHLYDGPMTIPQIMDLELSGHALAYLSACDTNLGGTGIPDEGITPRLCSADRRLPARHWHALAQSERSAHSELTGAARPPNARPRGRPGKITAWSSAKKTASPTPATPSTGGSRK